MQSFLGFSSYYRNHIKYFSHIPSILYKLCSKDVVFEIIKERRDAYDRIKHELTNSHFLILPDFKFSFKLYIDAAFSQVLQAALNKRQIVDGEPREGVICCILSLTIIYKEGKSCTNADALRRWPLDNFRSNQAYEPEVAAKIPIHSMEIDRRKNFGFSEWAPEGNTPDSEYTESEGTETPILGIRSSELHNEFFSEVMKTYSKHKQCLILL
ncbi:hypothetical protein O181_071038 [Austropuccinia psidii MF-1]|uniref:Reverse transcriptase/retrotransposon-derived protein RNase H-like domain-containing protein n=1 Tax=Austropuccinia psidii MF-1 TaxID=1389203 RepID=A0A9Q3I7U4_9BASI|nr:hypothetical protein [Austropuccinia psidii MF-1]